MSLAGALAARGIGPGDAVAVQLPNVPEWVEIAYGARRLGAMCVAVNTRFGPHEVRDIVERSGAKFLITDLSGLDAEAPDPPDRSDPDAPWMVFTSSGTTGAPKLVVHTPRGIDAHAEAVADSFGFRADDAVVGAVVDRPQLGDGREPRRLLGRACRGDDRQHDEQEDRALHRTEG